MYINLTTNEYPISEQEIRRLYPNTSFSAVFTPPEEFAWVFPTARPVIDPITQYIQETSPEFTPLGHWEQRWIVLDYSPEQIITNQLTSYKATIPYSVSPRQIRQALTQVGLRSLVETTIANGDQNLKDWWEFSTVFERDHPQVITMGIILNQTEETLDNLWRLADTL